MWNFPQVLAQIGKGTHMKGRFAVFVVLVWPWGYHRQPSAGRQESGLADQVEAYPIKEAKAPPHATLFIGRHS